ncbi:hypothetical protein BASA82_000871 [Batrachochytrium salamandrivorans]|nr:hypothetical protein BASA82_000871 [Batrachochytrium salamandrivorans]
MRDAQHRNNFPGLDLFFITHPQLKAAIVSTTTAPSTTTRHVPHVPSRCWYSRMSILPGSSQRSAKPGGLVGLSDTMAGLSVGSSNRNSDIRRSSAINTATGRPSMGRQSMGFGGRPSLSAASSLSGQVSSNSKDPRPLRDKPWQTKAIKQLVSFLAQTGCPVAVSAKKLTSPSSKDFSDIFKFLYRMLEPNHEFKSKIEEELLPLLRTLRADQQITAVLYWISTCLAYLSWNSALVMEEIMCCNQFDEQSEIENDGMGGGSIGDSRQPEKIFHDYVIRTYIAFLEGSDDFDAIDRELMNSFDRKNEATIRDVERMRREHHALEEELASLTQGESPLDSLIRENSILGSDKEKFQTYIAHVEVKEQKLQEGLLSAKQELDIQEDELAQVTAEKLSYNKLLMLKKSLLRMLTDECGARSTGLFSANSLDQT